MRRQPQGECAGGRQSVGSGEGAVLQMDSVVDSHAERIDQDLARLWWSHGYDGGIGADAIFKFDGLRDRA